MSNQEPEETTPAPSNAPQKSQKRSRGSKIPRINSFGSEKVPWGGSLIRVFRKRSKPMAEHEQWPSSEGTSSLPKSKNVRSRGDASNLNTSTNNSHPTTVAQQNQLSPSVEQSTRNNIVDVVAVPTARKTSKRNDNDHVVSNNRQIFINNLSSTEDPTSIFITQQQDHQRVYQRIEDHQHYHPQYKCVDCDTQTIISVPANFHPKKPASCLHLDDIRASEEVSIRIKSEILATLSESTSPKRNMKYSRQQITHGGGTDSNNRTNLASENDAAAKIQAGFRGYKVRKEMKQVKEKGISKLRRKSSTKIAMPLSGSSNANQNLEKGKKIPSEDDLRQKSATKIQAGIRGFLARKKVKDTQN